MTPFEAQARKDMAAARANGLYSVTMDITRRAREAQLKNPMTGRPKTTTARLLDLFAEIQRPAHTLELSERLGVTRQAALSAMQNLQKQGRAEKLDKKGPRACAYWVVK